jgi:hypothetical protein
MSSENATAMLADQLEALIQRHLLGRVRLRWFRVLVQERGLILQGCASTYYAKQLAQHAAMKVSGLPILANEIEVQCVQGEA